MANHDDEISARAGDVVEGHEYIGPQVSYRYCTGTDAVVIGGQLFAPAVARRSALSTGGTQDTPALTVTLPVTAQLVIDYAFTTPPRSLRHRVHRRQARSAESVIVWDGQVVAFTPRGREAEVKSTSQLGARLGSDVPGIAFQRQCNHFLYDARCRVSRLPFDWSAAVTNASGLTVTVSSIGPVPDQWYRAGEIVRDSDGERRTIVDQLGAVLTLSSPFRTIANGNGVTLYPGCDHTIETCISKFNNRENFGGMPSCPSSNPWAVGLQLVYPWSS